MSASGEPSGPTRTRPGRSSVPSDGSDGARQAPPPRGSDRRAERESRSGEKRALARQRLIESRLTPNAISLSGFALTIVAAVLIVFDQFVIGGILFFVGAGFDALDGRYSRMSGKGTQFGAFLDSTLDRVQEGAVLAAVGAHFASAGDEVAVAATIVAVLGSLMVSYTRARAEALGVDCKVGIAQRPPRVAILALGIVLTNVEIGGLSLLALAVYVLAVLTSVTALQRVLHVRGKLREADGV